MGCDYKFHSFFQFYHHLTELLILCYVYCCHSSNSILPFNFWLIYENFYFRLKQYTISHTCHDIAQFLFLSGVPDLFDRTKILSGGDLSHYQVPHCIRVVFYFVWFVFIHHNYQFYFELCIPIVTFWIFTYHKIWILLIIFCFIWNYWIIYFLTCLEVFWNVVS